MTIGQGPRTFAVSEYELVGQERAAGAVRSFRDRMLLISRLRSREGEPEAYVTRHYADGAEQVFRFHAQAAAPGDGTRTLLARGRAYPVGPDGTVAYHWVAQIELEVEPATGRVEARGW
jgi:hypothetical protein